METPLDEVNNASGNSSRNLSEKLLISVVDLQTTTIVYTFSIVLSSLFSLSIIFNMVSVVTILAARVFTPINLLILNLAVADLTYTLGIPMFIAHAFMKSWPFGQLGCKLFIFTEFSGIIVGIMTVSALSVERYFEVVDKKKRAQQLSNKFKSMLVVFYIFFTWMVALAASLPFIDAIKLISDSRNNYICGSEWSDLSFKIYFSIKFFFIFLLPYVVIVVSSIKLLLFLATWKQTIGLHQPASSRRPRRSLSMDISSTVMMINKQPRVSICLPAQSPQQKQQQQTPLVVSAKYLNVHASNSSFGPSPRAHRHHRHSPSNPFMDPEADSSLLYQHTTTTEATSQEAGGTTTKSRLVSSCSSVALTVETEVRTTTVEPAVAAVVATSAVASAVAASSSSSIVNAANQQQSPSKGLNRRLTTSINYATSVRQKASCLVLIIIVLFLFQWSPLCVFQLVIIFSNDLNIPNIQLVNLLVSTLSYSNTIANPILYMLLTYNFKLYFKKSFNYNPSLSNIFARKKTIST